MQFLGLEWCHHSWIMKENQSRKNMAEDNNMGVPDKRLIGAEKSPGKNSIAAHTPDRQLGCGARTRQRRSALHTG